MVKPRSEAQEGAELPQGKVGKGAGRGKLNCVHFLYLQVQERANWFVFVSFLNSSVQSKYEKLESNTMPLLLPGSLCGPFAGR